MENSLNNQDAIKQCNACRRKKPVSEFHRDNATSDGYRSRCRECVKVSKRNRVGTPKRYDSGVEPSIRITQSCPCKDCEYEKPCRILGLTCPRYVSWQKGISYKKQPRIPDKYLDGTIPGPGVI